jgi:hypothetical protein
MPRRCYPLLATLLFLAACSDLPKRETTAPPLTRSAACAVGGEDTTGRPYQTPVATIAMNNDGGWCWMTSSETQWGRVYGPFLRVTQEPQNGTLRINTLETGTRVAYRPNPGFAGTDTFQTISRELNYQVNYEVTVTR